MVALTRNRRRKLIVNNHDKVKGITRTWIVYDDDEYDGIQDAVVTDGSQCLGQDQPCRKWMQSCRRQAGRRQN